MEQIGYLLRDALQFGLPYGLLALGVFITFRLLDFADMTCEGSYIFGGATAVALIAIGWNPWISTLFAIVAGIAGGLITGLLHTKLKVPGLLSGIITMTGLFSITMIILGFPKLTSGKEITFSTLYDSVINLSPSNDTVYSLFNSFIDKRYWAVILTLAILVIAITTLIYFFFGTEIGMSMRATGMNQKMSRAQGINTNIMIILGLAISNGLIALAGALSAQRDFSSSVTSGQGMLVVGLASIIIGEAIFGKRSFKNWIISVILGAIVYYLIIAVALALGMPNHMLKFLYALIIAIILMIPVIKPLVMKKREAKKNEQAKQIAKERKNASVEANLVDNESSVFEINYAEKIENPKPMLEVKNVTKIFNPTGNVEDIKIALDDLSVTINEGEFVTIIGGNGSGKSTFFNCVSGVYDLTEGSILINGNDVSKLPEYKRANFIGKVAQDPYQGTAANMSILENMSLAMRRNKKKSLRWGFNKNDTEMFKDRIKNLGLGLENRMTAKIGLLSGGQRQAVTLLMATLQKPDLLFLDEHTAALDPKTARVVLDLTNKIVRENNLTTVMVTHNMKDAIKYGDRLLMFNNGKIIYDVSGEEKKNLTVEELLKKFENQVEFSDKDILAE